MVSRAVTGQEGHRAIWTRPPLSEWLTSAQPAPAQGVPDDGHPS